MTATLLDQYKAHTALALEGHVFDSLTLNKALDTILAKDGHFLITNVRIGASKEEVSSVHLTVFGKDDAHLKQVLEALAPLAPQTLSGHSHLETVTVAGLLPHGAAVLGYVPLAVSFKDQGVVPAGSHVSNAIVLKHHEGTLVPVVQTSLAVGDQVVVESDGFVWHQI